MEVAFQQTVRMEVAFQQMEAFLLAVVVVEETELEEEEQELVETEEEVNFPQEEEEIDLEVLEVVAGLQQSVLGQRYTEEHN